MQARRRAQRLAQAIQIGLANHEGRALEAAAVVVGAEADAAAAGRLALRVGEELDRGLMPIAHVARLLDDLAAAPVHLERPRQLARCRHHALRREPCVSASESAPSVRRPPNAGTLVPISNGRGSLRLGAIPASSSRCTSCVPRLVGGLVCSAQIRERGGGGPPPPPPPPPRRAPRRRPLGPRRAPPPPPRA